MRWIKPALIGLAVLGLAGCIGENGYVEIKTVPSNLAAPTFYFDGLKLDPLKRGGAVLQQRVGTVKLALQNGAGNLVPLCDIQVRKNRITTVTVSLLERPPRCQCRTARDAQACLG